MTNEPFRNSYLKMFKVQIDENDYDNNKITDMIEGASYAKYIPKDPTFENLIMAAAFDKKYVHTYVDTTKVYGFWTEDIFIPISGAFSSDDDPNVAYCLFMYTLNREMDTGKFAAVSPDISSFVIKACLELRNEKDFLTSMNVVTEDIRDYTNAYGASMVTYDKDERSYQIIAESSVEGKGVIKEAFSHVPFEIIESWDRLLRAQITLL